MGDLLYMLTDYILIFKEVCLKKYFPVLVLIIFSLTTVSIAQTTILHSYSGETDDGGIPWDSVILDGSTLYGMTSEGGTNIGGMIFKIGINGSGFEILHSFLGGPIDGWLPTGGLIQNGSTLYGMTNEGGVANAGTIFKIGTDGSSYQVLHSFDVLNPTNGCLPYGALLQDGSTLYGMTEFGGFYNLGTIFKIQTDGSGFELLHSLNYLDITNGGEPYGALIQDGTTLFGMTYWGGDYDCGTIFKIQTDGSGFELLHIFECENPANGSGPLNSLIQIGSILYGMTETGGLYDAGTIFKIGTDGNGFEILHSFVGDLTDGGYPAGTLIRIRSKLIGMTSTGGMYDAGTIFKIGSDGYDYQVLHSFAGGIVSPLKISGSADDINVNLTKVVRDNRTHNRGPLSGIMSNDLGSSLSKPFADADGALPWWGSLAYGNEKIYGMTVFGGSNNLGTIFSFPYSSLVIISGNVKYSNNNPIEGLEIVFSNSGLKATTDATGYYERFITKGWSGTARPSMTGHYFTPISYTYSSIQTNAPNQDYIGTKDAIHISGHVRDGINIGVEGVAVAFSNGGATVITNATGHYSTSVTNGWSGTSTATKDDWSFDPESYTYPVLTTNQTDQDYVGTDLTLAIEDVTALPMEFTVLPAYPNPFNPSTTISYGIDIDSKVNITIYDITGQLINTLVNTEQTQGWYSVTWNGTNNLGTQVPAGIYLSRISSNNEVKTTKLMLLK